MTTDLQTIAASKAISAKAIKAARPSITVGSHNVDFWLRVTGSMNVGEDYKSLPTVAIPYKTAFAALCHVAGCTGKAGVAMIQRAMEIALADESDAEARDALTIICPKVAEVEKTVIEPMIASLEKLSCKGKVTTKLTAEIVPTPQGDDQDFQRQA